MNTYKINTSINLMSDFILDSKINMAFEKDIAKQAKLSSKANIIKFNAEDIVDKIKTLVGEKKLYLIVDCAVNRDFKPLYYSENEVQILMADRYLKMFKKSAAYLMKLDLDSFFNQREAVEFIIQSIGQNWATFVISDKSLKDLSVELKKIINIRNEYSGNYVLYRFYDPRRLDTFFDALILKEWLIITNKIGGTLFTLVDEAIKSYDFSCDNFKKESENNIGDEDFRFSYDFAKRLELIKLNEYFDECVKDLCDINYENNYPSDKKKYKAFVKVVYEQAVKFGLDNEKYAFGLMLLWHFEGVNLAKDYKFMRMLSNNDICSREKYLEIRRKLS